MNNNSLFVELEKLLRMESAYCTEDGVLLKNAIVEAALALRPELIAKLLSHDGLKRNFFTEVEGVLVFDKVRFQKFVMNKRFLPDSYTSFKNKVGLTNEDGDFLSESREVVLSWPYKDCVLEGGQTKEDAKRNEVFWNEILAPDEINRLTEPKVLTNFKRYDKDGEHEVDSISMDDNLIIKGNNLLALHSLKKKYVNKVKMIFIDPPYYFIDTKPSDTFSYNSNFKLSSWLVFMRNRLDVAYKLLTSDGILYMAISDEGAHYLKVLTDDIFGMGNFIADVTWESRKSISSDSLISENNNHILVYAKDKDYIDKNNFRLTLDIESFAFDDNDGRGKYRLEPFDAPGIRKNLSYEIINPNTNTIYTPPVGRCWRTEESTYLKFLSENRIRFGANGTAKPQYKAYYSEVKAAGKGKASSTIWHNVAQSIIWQEMDTNTNATKDQVELFGENVFTNPKPEDLIKRAIELATNENDIVLDFFMGSATTQAVAMKMKRRFIGFEQMDYIETVSVPRLIKVIKGEQSGISKSVNWQGGGSFVYCELAKANQQFADDIEQASSSEELATIWQQMQETGFLSWKVNPKEIDANADDFTTLAIEDQKRFLIECLDKNLLYVPYSEIDNAEFGISENDKKINNQFYQTK